MVIKIIRVKIKIKNKLKGNYFFNWRVKLIKELIKGQIIDKRNLKKKDMNFCLEG
jgi:hypothetical protein